MTKHVWARSASILFGTLALLSVGFTSTAFAQQRTVEEKQTGASETQVDTRNSTVVYIEGNHLVVRQENGTLQALQIPPEERFNIDGQKLTLQELKPGMVLTQEVISTTRPIVVKTVEIVDGTVWHAGARRLVIRTHEGKLVDYLIPKWGTIKIGGEERQLHELKRGDHISATIITEEPMTVVDRETRSHGHHPAN